MDKERKHILFFILLIVIASVLLVSTIWDYGLAWDEPINIVMSNSYSYLYQLTSYAGASKVLHKKAVDKILNISALYYREKKPETHAFVYREITGFFQFILNKYFNMIFIARLTTIIFFIIMLSFIYFFLYYLSKEYYFAFITCLLFLFSPVFFAHSHFATLDFASTCFAVVILALFCYLIFFNKFNFYYSILLSLLFGLSIGVKETSGIIIIPMIFCLIYKFNKKNISNFLAFCFFSAIFFILTNIPFYFFYDLIFKIIIYWFKRNSEGQIVKVLFFSKIFAKAPWYYIIYYFFISQPIFISLASIVSFFYFGSKLKKFFKKTELTFFEFFGIINFIACISYLFIFSLKFAPKFDGIRLAMPALAFSILMIASFTYSIKVKKIEIVKYLILIILLINTSLACYAYHPFQLSFHNIAGGPNFFKNFDRTYWGEVLTMKKINELSKITQKKKKTVLVKGMATDVINFYKLLRWLPMNFIPGEFIKTPKNYKGFVLIYRRDAFLDDFSLNLIKTQKPIWTVKFKNYNFLELYEVL